MKTKMFPKVAFGAFTKDSPQRISKMVPARPKINPKTFRFSMRSFMIIAERTSTIIGVVTIKTELIMGEV